MPLPGPLSSTRTVYTCKSINVSYEAALAAVRHPPTLAGLSPLVQTIERSPTDPQLYTITERPLFLGIPYKMSFTARFIEVPDGVDTEVYPGGGTALHGAWRVKVADGAVLVSEEIRIQAFAPFMPLIIANIESSREAAFERLAAKLEDRPVASPPPRKVHVPSTIWMSYMVLTVTISMLFSNPLRISIISALSASLFHLCRWLWKCASDPYGLWHIPLNQRSSDRKTGAPHAEWLNMGYWKDTDVFPEACEALALKLFEAAQFSEGDNVLDVGHGTGESLVTLLTKPSLPRPRKITGITSLAVHAERARHRIENIQSQIPVEIHVGDAVFNRSLTESHKTHPLDPVSTQPPFDIVLALDCAYHFQTRKTFLQQSYARLASGGRIALADIVFPETTLRSRRDMWILSATNQLPVENRCTPDQYCSLLRGIGFVDVHLEDITNEVFPGFARFLKSRGGAWWVFGHFMGWYRGIARFVIVSGHKP